MHKCVYTVYRYYVQSVSIMLTDTVLYAQSAPIVLTDTMLCVQSAYSVDAHGAMYKVCL